MADGYLEQHQLDYEARKETYLRKKRHLPKKAAKTRNIERPEDEAL